MLRSRSTAVPCASVLALALGLLAAPAAHASASGDSPFAGAMRVADTALGKMRGGFDAGGGMTINFGIEMAGTLNGLPMAQLTVNGTGIGTQLLPAGTNLPTIDPSTVVSTVALAQGVLTLIRNTQSNVAITTTRTVNIDISGIANAVRQTLAAGTLTRAVRFSVR